MVSQKESDKRNRVSAYLIFYRGLAIASVALFGMSVVLLIRYLGLIGWAGCLVFSFVAAVIILMLHLRIRKMREPMLKFLSGLNLSRDKLAQIGKLLKLIYAQLDLNSDVESTSEQVKKNIHRILDQEGCDPEVHRFLHQLAHFPDRNKRFAGQNAKVLLECRLKIETLLRTSGVKDIRATKSNVLQP
jgi:hypothetical protein